MTQAQWQRAKEITADAFERELSSRAAFITDACGDDVEVRNEVLRLLAEAERCQTVILDTPNIDFRKLVIRPLSRTPCFSPGQMVAGRFRIDRFISRGGMGEVYAALDLELRELVALKTISSAIATSAGVIERFKREVKESRRITHRNVCRVYDLFSHEQSPGEHLWFLTMELLEGQTLSEALASRGALPAGQSVPLIGDMVAALSAAHALGIVHRDFKPSNVMLVKSGAEPERAVVMDFGLALDLSTEAARSAVAADGTPAYMAPEQAAGGEVGFATDQFALGLVICEMLTGSRPLLDRDSGNALRRQLNMWLRLRPRQQLNGRARRVIRRCLEFRPEKRFRDVRDVVPVLEGTRQRARLRWAVGAAVVTAAFVIALLVAIPDQGERVTEAVALTSEAGLASDPAISRDGKWVVYSSDGSHTGNVDIWIQATGGGRAKRLTTDPAEDWNPTISPDGKLVAFRSERNGGGIYVVGSDASGERLLVQGGESPAFSPDGGSIAYWMGNTNDPAPSGQLYVISPSGGPPRRLAGNFADARYPTWNSTGQLILFEGCRPNEVAASTCADWWVVRAEGSEPRNTGAVELLRSHKIETKIPPQKAWRGDEILFSGAQGSTVALWALPLSRGDLHAVGIPRRITSGDAKEREPAAAETGAIAFGRTTAAVHVWRLRLNRPGELADATRVTDNPSQDLYPGVSRDGRWLFFSRKIGDVRQLLMRDLSSEADSVLFASSQDQSWPVSDSTGTRVAFEAGDPPNSSILVIDRGGGQVRKLCSGCSHPTSWFAGNKAVFHTTAAGEIALLDVATSASHVVVAPEGGMIPGSADWNADSQYLLFSAGPKGAASQAYAVRLTADAAAPQGAWVALTHESMDVEQPRWSADGKAFFFLSRRDSRICVWGGRFDAVRGRASGEPFAVMHYDDLRFTPDRASPFSRGLTVAADSIFLNVGQVTETIWVGKLTEPPLAPLFRKLAFWQ